MHYLKSYLWNFAVAFHFCIKVQLAGSRKALGAISDFKRLWFTDLNRLTKSLTYWELMWKISEPVDAPLP